MRRNKARGGHRGRAEMIPARRELARLLWHIPEDDVAELARAIAESFIDELDLTERRRLDALIEGSLKKHIGPAAGRWAVKRLQELRENV